MSEIPVLETERLVLRAPTAVASEMYEAFSTDAEAAARYGGPLTAGRALARLAHDLGVWHLAGFGVWVVERRDTGRLIGVCGFWQGKGWPRELTWWLLPSARGAGFAAEASRAAVRHAYDGFGWDTVETYMEDHNEPARALTLRLGAVGLGRRTFPDGIERELYRIPPPPDLDPSVTG